jgi:uncharacterized protein (TIGR02996 family)
MADGLGVDFYENPVDHPDVQKNWVPALRKNPNDNLTKMMFADWLSEHGYDNAAHGMRWAAKYGKQPYTVTRGEGNYAGGFSRPANPHALTTYHNPAVSHELPLVFHRASNYEPLKHRGLGGQYGGNNYAYDIYTLAPILSTTPLWRAFIGRSHQLNWDEHGNPQYRYAGEDPTT